MNIFEDAFKVPLQHRTIREFKQEPVAQELLTSLMEVARRTATSNGLQQCSIIRVTDDTIKKELSLVGKQEYIQRLPELWVFVADQYRNSRIVEEKTGEIYNVGDIDRFFQAFTDAILTAQNVVNAAEKAGLGTLYLGSILNDPLKTCEILKLPKLTFPAVGLGLGYAAQEPQLKPRFDQAFRVFENAYETHDSYLDLFKDYDQEMQTYYDLRNSNRRVDSFTDQVVTKMKNAVEKRQDMIKAIKAQGFDTKS